MILHSRSLIPYSIIPDMQPVIGQYHAKKTLNNANSPMFYGVAEEAEANFRSGRLSNYRNRFSFDFNWNPRRRISLRAVFHEIDTLRNLYG